MHTGSGRATSGPHPVDEVLKVGEIPATDFDHHVHVADNVPRRDHVGLTSKESFEMVKPKPGKAHKNQRLQAG
jgi:hypothetical protein